MGSAKFGAGFLRRLAQQFVRSHDVTMKKGRRVGKPEEGEIRWGSRFSLPSTRLFRETGQPEFQRVFQTPWQIIDARRGVSAFDVLGMTGNLISNGTRARSNAGDSFLIDWGGLGDVAIDLVSCLLEWGLDLLLSAG